MRFTRFDVAALAATSWKNGGGTTREIACQPQAADMAQFDWRVSVATIAEAGAFSVFPGVDRVILLLGGDGVRLHAATGLDHRLDTPLVPFAFAGDTAVDCALLGGMSIDFNVMARRDRCRADVKVMRQACELGVASDGLVLAWGGTWNLQCGGDQLVCPAGAGLWWLGQGAQAGWHAQPQSPDAALVAVRLLCLDAAA